ncbi:MAG: acyl-CoA thioesterase [Verrucomicrobia bacterium]|nr:acyl-CoA thioesterase [Verrucomicrobiota bacterium]
MPPPTADVPSHFHFRHRRMVEFADTDLAGLMHFANFLRFAECAEHAFFRSLGFRVHSTDGGTQQGWPRLEVSCQYFRPARFEQTLEICLRIAELRTNSLTYGFWIFCPETSPRAPLAAGTCSIVHVALDSRTHQIHKAPIPTALRHAFEGVMAAAPPAP